MTSSGTVALKEVWSMLGRCAPGHRRQERDHHWCIYFQNRTYPTFPRGEHGARKNPEIQIGHVRKMARHLGILDCAREQLPQLC